MGKDQTNLLAEYKAYLVTWNKTHNLISKKQAQKIDDHIADSLIISPFLNKNIIDRSHCTSFKFLDTESEFKECGLNEKYIDKFSAPFVMEARVSIGRNYIRKFEIKENGDTIYNKSLFNDDNGIQKVGISYQYY